MTSDRLKAHGSTMQIIVHQWAFPSSFEQLELLPQQEFVSDWFGYDVEPPAGFSFGTDGEYLWFLARRNAPALSHPGATPGAFQAELWKYDVAEWFMASQDGSRYWEFNLAPNGAWWACAFSGKRQPDAAGKPLEKVETMFLHQVDSWCAMAKVPLAELSGINIRKCRLAAAFILNSPDQIFMTSALDLSGEPDFHRPEDFSAPVLK